MGIFENGVGRPSNRVKKIRLIIGTIIPVLIVALVAGTIVINLKKGEINTSSYNISASKKAEIEKN